MTYDMFYVNDFAGSLAKMINMLTLSIFIIEKEAFKNDTKLDIN